MAHKNDSSGKKSKPRGRPFPKNNFKGKARGNVLDTERHKGDAEPMNIETNIVIAENKEDETQGEVDKLIDSIHFSDGKNSLNITLTKKNNRLFRLQIFLNKTNNI
jgi:hypothetical protein